MRKPVEPRYCQQCNKEIDRGARIPSDYRRIKFCGAECRKVAKVQVIHRSGLNHCSKMHIELKPCELCKELIPRNQKSPANYHKLRFCSPECRVVASRSVEHETPGQRSYRLELRRKREAEIKKKKAEMVKYNWLYRPWLSDDSPTCEELSVRLKMIREKVRKMRLEKDAKRRWISEY